MGRKKYMIPFRDDSIDTRPKRRRISKLLQYELTKMYLAEVAYMSKTPENLRGGKAYLTAIYSRGKLNEALTALEKAYFY